LARRFATLDVLSHGRAITGLGIGWSKDEYEVSGIPYKYRGQRANEFLQLLKRIWTDEVVEFKGQFYSILASKIGPKHIQKPHPLEQLEQAINGLRESARKANKDPSKIRVFVLTYPNVQ
jgi:alkanesulfonate monooxygenase SsuD/methylene tetrahydromethanopterin reductase-like flavin-dependent oxidoreductase (luciferase family)